jgi:hypothetical protein
MNNNPILTMIDLMACTISPPVALKATSNKEKNMNVITERAAHADERAHLRHRAWGINFDKARAAERHFGLVDDEFPKTPKEFTERIAAGKFIFRDKDKADKEVWSGDILRTIRFRDPDKKEDRDGFKAEGERREKVYATLTDKIAILEPKDALKAMEEFEGKTFH